MQNTDDVICSHYKTIKSSDQRRQYKSDFQRQYDEYRALHAAIETMTCDFRRLEEKLNSKTPGTADYEVQLQSCCSCTKFVMFNCGISNSFLMKVTHLLTDYRSCITGNEAHYSGAVSRCKKRPDVHGPAKTLRFSAPET